MKKVCVFAFALTLTAALLAGCARDGVTPPISSEAQEIVIGEPFDLGSFDPIDGMLDNTRMLAYNQLVELDADFNLVPGLAENWEIREGGSVWEFKLRQDVTFHDGEPWNIEAALANLERLEGHSATENVELYETPDDYTLIFHLTQPTYTLASELARTNMSMVSPAALDSGGGLEREAGTGPYRLTEWTPGQSYAFEAYEDYWGSAPNIKKITFRVITDPQSRANALESGEIDMISGYPSLAAVKSLTNNDQFQLISKTRNTSGAIYFNLAGASPVRELAVRQALGRALDLETIIDGTLAGLASAPTGFFSPVFGTLAGTGLTPGYTPDEATALLEAGGWAINGDGIYEKDGEALTFTLTYSADNSEDSLLAPVLRDELKKLGIDMRLNAVEGAALDNIMVGKEYDALLTEQGFIPTYEPSFHYAAGYWRSGSCYDVYHSDELDAMIDELTTMTDPAGRAARHADIQESIMAQAPVLMVYHRNSVRLAKANIDFDIGADDSHVYVALKDAAVFPVSPG